MKNKDLLSIAFAACLTTIATVAIASENEITKQEAMEAAGRAVFVHRCRACHSLDVAKNTFGPSLVGVVGRASGSLPRFAYSEQMKNSKLVWDEETLRSWIADNEKVVPGTRMRHVSITDVTEQDFLLAFLKNFK